MLAKILLVVVFAVPAMAQEDSAVLETITVQGTKEGKSYFEDPGSIAILKESDAPATGTQNTISIINAVPNVTVSKEKGGSESFSIRGITNKGVTGFQNDNLASILIDGIFQTDLAIQSGSFDLWDFERIEILRGAQSTTQGVNSLAGLILLNHQAPQFNNGGAAKFGLGNRWHGELGALTNNVFLSEKLATRISYNKEIDDGFIKNVANGNDKWGMWNKDRVNMSSAYKLSDTDLITFLGKFHRNIQGGNYVQSADPFKYEVNENQDFNQNTHNFQVGSSWVKRLSERTTNTVIVGVSRSEQAVATDADQTAQDTAGVRKEKHADHFVSFENQLSYKGENFDNLLGLHVHDTNLRDVYDMILLLKIGPPVYSLQVDQLVNRPRRTYAIFDSATWKFAPSHSLIAGVRGEYVINRYSTTVGAVNLSGANPTVDNTIAQTSGSYSGERENFAVLPKVGYAFEANGNFAGATYTRGYRSAGASINRWRATANAYNPEYTNNYEASYKRSGSNFQAGINVFYIDWSDQQVETKLSNNQYDTQVVNVGKSTVYGAELEGRYDLTANHQFTSGVGYTKTKFDDFKYGTYNFDGHQFPFAPQWTARASYRWKPISDLDLLSIARYVDKSFIATDNIRTADPQFYLDLLSSYALGNWMFQGYVNNVLNGKFHIVDGRPTSSPAASAYQSNFHQVSTPTEYGARVSYFW